MDFKTVFTNKWHFIIFSVVWLIWGLMMTSSGDSSPLHFCSFIYYLEEKMQDNKMFNTHFKVIDICPFLIQSIAAGGQLLTISTLLPKAGSQLPFRIQESYLIHLCKSKPTAFILLNICTYTIYLKMGHIGRLNFIHLHTNKDNMGRQKIIRWLLAFIKTKVKKKKKQ